MGGSLGEAHADSIVRVMDLAGRSRAPVVGFIESGGARLQDGHAGLAGYGRIFRKSVELSERVPQISVVTGVSAGGGSYSPALTDFVLMTSEARMFLTGPRVVREALGEEVTMEELGGPRVHEGNGVCQLVADSESEATGLVRELLGLLPQGIGERAAIAAPAPAGGPDPDVHVPAEARKVYDVRDVVDAIVDAGHLLEISSRWARNMVTGFARIEGRPVGVVANQPRRLGGVIDAEALGEGGALRPYVRPLRDPARRARRYPGIHARQATGGCRRDPPRRLAAARVRRGLRSSRHGRAPQGIWRRRDHDELQGPRRGHGVRVAGGGDRDHGRQSGRRGGPPPPAARGGATPRPWAPTSRPRTPRSTSRRRRRPRAGSSTR